MMQTQKGDQSVGKMSKSHSQRLWAASVGLSSDIGGQAVVGQAFNPSTWEASLHNAPSGS